MPESSTEAVTCNFLLLQKFFKMAMGSTTLPKVESKLLDFSIDIQDAQFNHGGWYYLILTLQNSFSKDFSNVKLSKNDSVFTKGRQARTDFTKQEENAPLSFFKDKKFTFRLPRGEICLLVFEIPYLRLIGKSEHYMGLHFYAILFDF